jgi:NitT/TauT family transport system permease protein
MTVPYRIWRRIERPAWIFAVLALSLAVWQLAVGFFDVPRFILPPPSEVIAAFAESPMMFARATLFTLWTTVAGFGLAVVLGIVLAIGIVYSPLIERTVYTLLVSLNALPKVALAPLFVVWMGTGITPKIAIALTIAIFSIVIDTVLGLRSVDPDLLALARSAHASPLQMLFKIRLPHALPSIFSGMKISISVALVGAIVGEFVAGNNGLGQAILVAQGSFQTARMFVAITILGVLGTVLFYAVELAETILMPWHISQRGSTRNRGTI